MTLTKRELGMRLGEATGLTQAQALAVVQKT